VHAPEAPIAGRLEDAPADAVGHGDLQGTLRIAGNEI